MQSVGQIFLIFHLEFEPNLSFGICIKFLFMVCGVYVYGIALGSQEVSSETVPPPLINEVRKLDL